MSGVAQDEAAAARDDAIVARVLAALQVVLHAALEEQRAALREVPGLIARTEELEQFVDGLKPDGADPVVRRVEYNHALGVMETTQTLAQELEARVDRFAVDEFAALKARVDGFAVDGFAALKAQVDSVVARVPDDRQSQWIQGLYLELEQRVQEDVKRRLDATLKEYRRDSSTTHQQNQLDGVTDRMNNFGIQLSKIQFENDAIKEGLRELEAKLEDSPMPRMARGAARGGMRGIPLNGRPAEAADVKVEGSAGATGSTRGRRGDKRLTFEARVRRTAVDVQVRTGDR